MTTTTDRPATVHGGDAQDWYAAYMAVRQSWAQLKGCGPALPVYWPADRLPLNPAPQEAH